MDLESAGLDLLFPHVIMNLNVVQDGIDQSADVRILIREKLQHNRHHLGLMKDDFSCRLKEEELEERVEDLLHHLIILLLGSQKVLKHFDQVRRSDMLSDLIVTADRSDQHYTL